MVDLSAWNFGGRLSLVKRRVEASDFTEYRLMAALTKEETAKMIGVTRRTIENWERGRVRIPYSAYLVLLLTTGARLPAPGWDGWICRAGYLCSPAGEVYTAGELHYLSLVFAMAREWQRSQGLQPVNESLQPPAQPGFASGNARKAVRGRVAQATAAGNPPAGREAADGREGDGGLPGQPETVMLHRYPPQPPALLSAAACLPGFIPGSPRTVIRGEMGRSGVRLKSC